MPKMDKEPSLHFKNIFKLHYNRRQGNYIYLNEKNVRNLVHKNFFIF